MSEYYLVSKKHMHAQDFAVLFWGKNSSGYYYNTDDAGIYSENDAKVGHGKDTIPVEKAIIDSIKKRYVIDGARLGYIVINNKSNRKKIGIKVSELFRGESNWGFGAFVTPKEYMRRNAHTLSLVAQIAAEVTKATPKPEGGLG